MININTSIEELAKFKTYEDLIKSQPYFKNQDFSPKIVDNVFSDEQLKFIFNEVDNYPKEKIRIQKWGGQGVYDEIILTKDIRDRIEFLVNQNVDDEMILVEASVVRYSPEHGYEVKLFPHFDTRPSQRMVFDIQLKSNIDWGIIVEGTQFNLQDNQALIFSGTEQIHWRENKKIPANSVIDMIFCWLKYKNDRPMTEEQRNIMKDREIYLTHIDTKISVEELEYSNEQGK